MPLYEYQCRKCKHRFERIQKFSDPILKKCPECGGALEQLISAPAVQFKGSGWYVTDYARKGAAKAAEGASDKAESAGEEKAEAKPKAEKPEHKKHHHKKKD
jgi:putative FmdB family regulatory protein